MSDKMTHEGGTSGVYSGSTFPKIGYKIAKWILWILVAIFLFLWLKNPGELVDKLVSVIASPGPHDFVMRPDGTVVSAGVKVYNPNDGQPKMVKADNREGKWTDPVDGIPGYQIRGYILDDNIYWESRMNGDNRYITKLDPRNWPEQSTNHVTFTNVSCKTMEFRVSPTHHSPNNGLVKTTFMVEFTKVNIVTNVYTNDVVINR